MLAPAEGVLTPPLIGALPLVGSGSPPRVPSASQRAAIEADPQPLLVCAGPGAGKTYCLIERIRFLIDRRGFDPARICVFTFTNKAAGEIAARLDAELGPSVENPKRGTIHSFCSELLREFGDQVGLQEGFGIADEQYQRALLHRLRIPRRQHNNVLEAFARYRFRGIPLGRRYEKYFEAYRSTTSEKNIVDFDGLLLKAAEVFRLAPVASTVRKRWDAILVDEFQDLNPVQYSIVRELARDHRHVFAVGDDEQSVYSWTGADPLLFAKFANDFEIVGGERLHHLEENHRCPSDVLAFARRLVSLNEQIFKDRPPQETKIESRFPVSALAFTDDEAECSWIIHDLQREHAERYGGFQWGDVGVLYRTHKIGSALESAFLNAGIPCCLAQGRALADDPVVAYVLAALRVIGNPSDEIHQEHFYHTVLPESLLNDARVRAEEAGNGIVEQLEQMARTLPRVHGDAKKIWRGIYALKNLGALAKNHTSLSSLVEEILSERVGEYRTILEDHHEELSDPASHDEVETLADRVVRAAEQGRQVWMPRLGGGEIAGKKMLAEMGVSSVQLGGAPAAGSERIAPADLPSLGFALGLFKTAQLVRTRNFTNAFRDFTVVDLETTDKDITSAEIVEIAAVRVRHGRPVDEFHSRVRPRVPITAGALGAHGISDSDVANAPFFETIWKPFRDFCGSDVLVAHNGYKFDFPILRRMAQKLPRGNDFSTYDTLPLARKLHSTSRKLEHLANRYGIHPGQSHSALHDCRTLAKLFPALCATKTEYTRKTALVNLLDQVGIGLALSDRDSLCEEARRFLEFVPVFSLGRYTDCLDCYRIERDLCGDRTLPDVDELVALLGGAALMERLRMERSADQRYPETMARLRRLMEACADGLLPEQICAFLERVVLSKQDGIELARDRVNLLTLHSTKGLEFSRVYIVGVEDEQFIQMPPSGTVDRNELEEARRLLYVGMTRTKERLVMTRTRTRNGKTTGGHRFLDEMGLAPRAAESRWDV
jgi:superfamily I DNA/RNA helicase/DNA polymerase III epsilon subunit-like protein